MEDFLVTEESALSFDNLDSVALDVDDVSVDLSAVSADGGNLADVSVSAIGESVVVDVDAFAWDGGSSVSGHLEALWT